MNFWPGGSPFRATGNYDGIGRGDFVSFDGGVWVIVPLN